MLVPGREKPSTPSNVMGQPTEPSASLTRFTSFPTSQKTFDASRTEILVIAIGVLLLVIQLALVIWFCAPRAFARTPPEQRAITWAPVKNTRATHEKNDDRPSRSNRRRRHDLRRSSTWNGRAVPADQDGHPVRRRKSSSVKFASGGLRRPVVFSSSSDTEDSDSMSGHSARRSARHAGFVGAGLALPMVGLSPRRLHSPEPELDSGKPREAAREMRLVLPSSAGLPAIFSPRSPRLGPIDQATLEILKGERRKSETVLALPETPYFADQHNMANGFDDLLRVNRRKTLLGDEDDNFTAEQAPRLSDKVLLSENSAPNDVAPRRRRKRRTSS